MVGIEISLTTLTTLTGEPLGKPRQPQHSSRTACLDRLADAPRRATPGAKADLGSFSGITGRPRGIIPQGTRLPSTANTLTRSTCARELNVSISNGNQEGSEMTKSRGIGRGGPRPNSGRKRKAAKAPVAPSQIARKAKATALAPEIAAAPPPPIEPPENVDPRRVLEEIAADKAQPASARVAAARTLFVNKQTNTPEDRAQLARDDIIKRAIRSMELKNKVN